MIRIFIIFVLMTKWTAFGQIDVIITSTEDTGNVDSVYQPDIWNYSTPLSKFGYQVQEEWIIRALIRASNDAFFYLKSNINSTTYDLYEIVIGSYGGRNVNIRLNGMNVNTKLQDYTGLLTDTAFTAYWIGCNITYCSLGRGFSTGFNILEHWYLKPNFHVNDIGIMTGFDSVGDWIIYLGELEFSNSISHIFKLTEKQQNGSTNGTTSTTADIRNELTTTTERYSHVDINTVIKELMVDKTTLTSNIRRKTSARDDRVSATCIGLAGTIFISLIVTGIIAMDISSVCMKTRKRNKRQGTWR